eukprot:Rhum_TRINITY_DN14654_c5_g1::Rhum_TRINITY_DN14654_c5_g1_i1::g.106305::m.106305
MADDLAACGVGSGSGGDEQLLARAKLVVLAELKAEAREAAATGAAAAADTSDAAQQQQQLPQPSAAEAAEKEVDVLLAEAQEAVLEGLLADMAADPEALRTLCAGGGTGRGRSRTLPGALMAPLVEKAALRVQDDVREVPADVRAEAETMVRALQKTAFDGMVAGLRASEAALRALRREAAEEAEREAAHAAVLCAVAEANPQLCSSGGGGGVSAEAAAAAIRSEGAAMEHLVEQAKAGLVRERRAAAAFDAAAAGEEGARAMHRLHCALMKEPIPVAGKPKGETAAAATAAALAVAEGNASDLLAEARASVIDALKLESGGGDRGDAASAVPESIRDAAADVLAMLRDAMRGSHIAAPLEDAEEATEREFERVKVEAVRGSARPSRRASVATAAAKPSQAVDNTQGRLVVREMIAQMKQDPQVMGELRSSVEQELALQKRLLSSKKMEGLRRKAVASVAGSSLSPSQRSSSPSAAVVPIMHTGFLEAHNVLLGDFFLSQEAKVLDYFEACTGIVHAAVSAARTAPVSDAGAVASPHSPQAKRAAPRAEEPTSAGNTASKDAPHYVRDPASPSPPCVPVAAPLLPSFGGGVQAVEEEEEEYAVADELDALPDDERTCSADACSPSPRRPRTLSRVHSDAVASSSVAFLEGADESAAGGSSEQLVTPEPEHTHLHSCSPLAKTTDNPLSAFRMSPTSAPASCGSVEAPSLGALVSGDATLEARIPSVDYDWYHSLDPLDRAAFHTAVICDVADAACAVPACGDDEAAPPSAADVRAALRVSHARRGSVVAVLELTEAASPAVCARVSAALHGAGAGVASWAQTEAAVARIKARQERVMQMKAEDSDERRRAQGQEAPGVAPPQLPAHASREVFDMELGLEDLLHDTERLLQESQRVQASVAGGSDAASVDAAAPPPAELSVSSPSGSSEDAATTTAAATAVVAPPQPHGLPMSPRSRSRSEGGSARRTPPRTPTVETAVASPTRGRRQQRSPAKQRRATPTPPASPPTASPPRGAAAVAAAPQPRAATATRKGRSLSPREARRLAGRRAAAVLKAASALQEAEAEVRRAARGLQRATSTPPPRARTPRRGAQSRSPPASGRKGGGAVAAARSRADSDASAPSPWPTRSRSLSIDSHAHASPHEADEDASLSLQRRRNRSLGRAWTASLRAATAATVATSSPPKSAAATTRTLSPVWVPPPGLAAKHRTRVGSPHSHITRG